MTEKELKKLNRYQLLELLVVQTERADELEKTVEQLRTRLEERELRFSQMGSIAEASVYLSGVLEAAQKAADLYLESAKKRAEEILEEARTQAGVVHVQTDEVRSCDPEQREEESAGKRMTNEEGKTKGKRTSKNRRAKK